MGTGTLKENDPPSCHRNPISVNTTPNYWCGEFVLRTSEEVKVVENKLESKKAREAKAEAAQQAREAEAKVSGCKSPWFSSSSCKGTGISKDSTTVYPVDTTSSFLFCDYYGQTTLSAKLLDQLQNEYKRHIKYRADETSKDHEEIISAINSKRQNQISKAVRDAIESIPEFKGIAVNTKTSTNYDGRVNIEISFKIKRDQGS